MDLIRAGASHDSVDTMPSGPQNFLSGKGAFFRGPQPLIPRADSSLINLATEDSCNTGRRSNQGRNYCLDAADIDMKVVQEEVDPVKACTD